MHAKACARQAADRTTGRRRAEPAAQRPPPSHRLAQSRYDAPGEWDKENYYIKHHCARPLAGRLAFDALSLMLGVLLQASQDCRYTAKQYTESMEYNEETKATAGTRPSRRRASRSQGR